MNAEIHSVMLNEVKHLVLHVPSLPLLLGEIPHFVRNDDPRLRGLCVLCG